MNVKSENKTEIVDILNKCLNKEIKEVYVTGYSEIRDGYNFFSTMNWWYYLEFEGFFLCVASSTTVGMIELYIHQSIQKNFELDNGDIFTVSPINKQDYLGQEVIGYDLIYDFDHQLFALGIQFKDNRYLDKHNKYVFFNSLTLDGFEVGDEKDKDIFLEDTRFYLKKFPEKL
jgi:hypothetical protein